MPRTTEIQGLLIADWPSNQRGDACPGLADSLLHSADRGTERFTFLPSLLFVSLIHIPAPPQLIDFGLAKHIESVQTLGVGGSADRGGALIVCGGAGPLP